MLVASDNPFFMITVNLVQKSKYSNYSVFKSNNSREEEQVQQRPTDSTEARPSINEAESSNRLSQQFAEDSEHTKKLLQELLAIKQQNNNLQRSFEALKVWFSIFFCLNKQILA